MPARVYDVVFVFFLNYYSWNLCIERSSLFGFFKACQYVTCNQYECSVNRTRMRELFSTGDVCN